MCGRFVAPCMALGESAANVAALLVLGGGGGLGALTKTFTMHDAADVQCVQPSLVVVLNGTYAMPGPSTCNGTCAMVCFVLQA